jgi:hypothetical protein
MFEFWLVCVCWFAAIHYQGLYVLDTVNNLNLSSFTNFDHRLPRVWKCDLLANSGNFQFKNGGESVAVWVAKCETAVEYRNQYCTQNRFLCCTSRYVDWLFSFYDIILTSEVVKLIIRHGEIIVGHPGSPEYKAGVLTSSPKRSVCRGPSQGFKPRLSDTQVGIEPGTFRFLPLFE